MLLFKLFTHAGKLGCVLLRRFLSVLLDGRPGFSLDGCSHFRNVLLASAVSLLGHQGELGPVLFGRLAPYPLDCLCQLCLGLLPGLRSPLLETPSLISRLHTFQRVQVQLIVLILSWKRREGFVGQRRVSARLVNIGGVQCHDIWTTSRIFHLSLISRLHTFQRVQVQLIVLILSWKRREGFVGSSKRVAACGRVGITHFVVVIDFVRGT